MAINYHAYLVRLWRDDGSAPWRIRVQDAQGDRAYLFATVEELTHFLSQITGDDRLAVPPVVRPPCPDGDR